MGSWLAFAVFSALIVVCSVAVVAVRNAVVAAVFLVLDLFFLAAIYAQLGADFVAAIQVIVYAGAILVLFLFVIMLLNLADDAPAVGKAALKYLSCAFIVSGFAYLACRFLDPLAFEGVAVADGLENTAALGKLLFINYLWPFELASILILLAVIASILIAKKGSSKAVAAAAATPTSEGR